MTKTPYELRYNLLMMAREILTENLMNERIRLENDWGLEREKASIRMGEGDMTATLPPYPAVPNIEPKQIIDLAKTLNEFISSDSTK
jgi:hypothetical protein